ncbi:MAG: DEAD/DEAH box helicase family protein [Candidatus Micrarchaeaceae archaeon]
MTLTFELPDWTDSLRPTQQTAINDVLAQFSTGSQIVFLEGPTGSGKTLIAEMVRQSLGLRAAYLCSSLALQEQFQKDYPMAAILKGRSNYPTYDSPSSFGDTTIMLSTADCTKTKTLLPACQNCTRDSEGEEVKHCLWCHPVSLCPYEQAKAAAIRATLMCSNIYYFLYEANYVGSVTTARPFIIIDECDTLEDVFMSYVEVRLTARRAHDLGISTPTKKTVSSTWVQWLADAIPQVRWHLDKVKPEMRHPNIKNIREYNFLTRLLGNLERIADPVTGLVAGGWVYTGYNQGDIAFKPVLVAPFIHNLLWRHAKLFLLMSATIISSDEMALSLGVTR